MKILALLAAATVVNIPVTVTTTPTGTIISIPAQTVTVPLAGVCGALPPNTTATIACPAGTRGNWVQGTTYTPAPYPQCFTKWLSPLSAPAGACTPITTVGACPVTQGTLTVNAVPARVSGIAPLLVFFDATSTTDPANIPANGSVFQDVTFTWIFGDTGVSGTGTWVNGASHGSTNVASGPVAAHYYVVADGAGDQPYTATVTATDGVNTASCTVAPVTAYDPSGPNGFGTTKCYYSTTPGAGCPVGTSTQSSTVPALGLSNTRLLFKCGDTFNAPNGTVSGTKGAIGSYGGCPATFKASAPGVMLTLANPSSDIRIMDLVLDGNGQKGIVLIDNGGGGTINGGNKPFQYTLLNLDAKGMASSYRWAAGGQMGIINSMAESVQGGPANCSSTGCNINVFPNYAGVGSWTSSGASEDYQFFAGNLFYNAPGANNNTYEVMRDSYGSKHIISNNTMHDAGPSYALIKFHNLDYASDGAKWSGTYTQNSVISDNYLYGVSGANCVEVSPQNAQSDERMRLIVIERNQFKCTENIGRQLQYSGVNGSIRSNIFATTSGSFGVQVAQRGIEPQSQFVKVYGNTFSGGGNAAAIAFSQSGNSGTQAVANSSAINNKIIDGVAVLNQGTNNTISNNTAAVVVP